MNIQELFEGISKSDLGKAIRAIAAKHALTAANRQHQTRMINQSKAFTHARFQVTVRGNGSAMSKEKALVAGVKAFMLDLSEYLKDQDVEFVGEGTNGKFVNNWVDNQLTVKRGTLIRGAFNTIKFTRISDKGMGTDEERMENYTPAAFVEFSVMSK